MKNIFANLPLHLTDERFETLLATEQLRIERIVSHGHASPPDFWFDQSEREWVIVLAGAARLRFADQDAPCEMQPGDFVDIAPHRRHRVEWTTPSEPTIWLAVHVRE